MSKFLNTAVNMYFEVRNPTEETTKVIADQCGVSESLLKSRVEYLEHDDRLEEQQSQYDL